MYDLNKIDKQIERYVINKFISMPKLFDSLGISYSENSTMYCPFHDNKHTKASKLYHDETGWQLWCFSEQQMYGPYDVYKVYKPEIDTHELAISILKRFPVEEREKLIKESGQELELDDLPFEDSLQAFKEHTIKYDELISNILVSLEKGEL